MERSIHLLDLIPRDKLEEILRSFTEVSGVASIITDTDGQPITKAHNFTPFCEKFCRSTAKGRARCYQSDSYGGTKSIELQQPHVYHCLNSGLNDAAIPIIVDEYHIANFLCGQVREGEVDEGESIRRAKSIGVEDVAGYLASLRKVRQMDRPRFLAIVNFMAVITQTISELALQRFLVAKSSKEYLNRVINSVPDCIMAVDSEMKVVLANDASRKKLGYDGKTLRGRALSSLLTADVALRDLKNPTGESQCHFVEGTARMRDGQTFPIQLVISSIDAVDERSTDYVAVLRDISEEKRIESLKEDLVGMMTHDLGNPTISIQKAINLMLDSSLGPLNDSQREVMELALSTSQQLRGMVVNFLDIYRSENGRFLLRRAQFDLCEAIREAISSLGFLAQEKGIDVQFEPPLESMKLVGDRNRIKRACVNLLANAINYSLDASEVRVSIQFVASGDPTVREIFGEKTDGQLSSAGLCILTAVQDEGYGIPESYQEAVFEKFFTRDFTDTSQRRGLGLGLAFCKLAIETHGGLICARTPNRPGAPSRTPGCVFYFLLPVNGNGAAAANDET